MVVLGKKREGRGALFSIYRAVFRLARRNISYTNYDNEKCRPKIIGIVIIGSVTCLSVCPSVDRPVGWSACLSVMIS